MRLTPSDPDVETLVGRIASEEIDLQPDFQRGEVWPTSKKQRLIDSILREWHVPPIHLIIDPDTHRAAVLDGQQRLAAIRDFACDVLRIDGSIEPLDDAIQRLDGLTFSQLPREWKARFNQFTIRVFRISDYEPAEPAELFFRLNQPTALTSAEKRNAFFGVPREQIRSLVGRMEAAGLSKQFWGFSGARMAYDDIFARACLTLENGTFKTKISSTALADRYRSGRPFSPAVIAQLRDTVDLLIEIERWQPLKLSLNKATAQSCLIFLSRLVQQASDPANLKQTVRRFLESADQIQVAAQFNTPNDIHAPLTTLLDQSGANALVAAYVDRSTSRVADTASVSIRDCALWVCFSALVGQESAFSNVKALQRLTVALAGPPTLRSAIDFEKWVSDLGWDLT